MRPRIYYVARQLGLNTPPSAKRLFSQTANGPPVLVRKIPAPGTGHIRILELNRPSARNAISRALLASLRAEIGAVAAQYGVNDEELPVHAAGADGPTRAVILASAADSCFCAGADLKERLSFTREETEIFRADLGATLSALATLPVPTISAVASIALGGGLELALTTHMRVLASTATVGLPETRLGIIPGAGGTYRLPALIGLARARDMIVTGRKVSASEAYFVGIADRIVDVEVDPDEDDTARASRARRTTLDAAVQLARQICEGGPVAVRAALEAVQAARPDVEHRMYERVLATEDRVEALRAFGEKRKPAFKGR